MATKLQDFKCNACDHVFEYLTHDGAQHYEHDDGEEPPTCPKCNSTECSITDSTPLVTKCHDPDAKKEILKRRSAEHTAKGLQKLAGHRGSLPPNLGRPGGPAVK
jgi:hypothetical protein